MIPARKRWGQHFLARAETADRIVAAARLDPSDTVVEVGPGAHGLSFGYTPTCGNGTGADIRFSAIELD